MDNVEQNAEKAAAIMEKLISAFAAKATELGLEFKRAGSPGADVRLDFVELGGYRFKVGVVRDTTKWGGNPIGTVTIYTEEPKPGGRYSWSQKSISRRGEKDGKPNVEPIFQWLEKLVEFKKATAARNAANNVEADRRNKVHFESKKIQDAEVGLDCDLPKGISVERLDVDWGDRCGMYRLRVDTSFPLLTAAEVNAILAVLRAKKNS